MPIDNVLHRSSKENLGTISFIRRWKGKTYTDTSDVEEEGFGCLVRSHCQPQQNCSDVPEAPR